MLSYGKGGANRQSTAHKAVFIKLWSTDYRWSAAVSEEKALQKLYYTLNEWKVHPYMFVLKLLLLVGLPQKVGELVLSITSCLPIIILENILNTCIEKNVVMVTLTTGMFILVTCVHFGVWRILRRRSACVPTDCEVVRDWRKFEKHWHKGSCSPLALSNLPSPLTVT
jgi:diacylglycerol kinase